MSENKQSKDLLVMTYYTPHCVTLAIEKAGEKVFEFSLPIAEAKLFAERLRINAERAEFQDKLTNEE